MSKKQPKLTPWFPADVKPARVGVYEVKDNEPGPAFCWWNGRYFAKTVLTAQGAAAWARIDRSAGPQFPWRGLAVKP